MTDGDQPPTDEAAQEPEQWKVKCATCGRLVDAEEITTVRGECHCGECIDSGLAAASALPFREHYDIRSVRWIVIGCASLFFLLVGGTTLMFILTYMRLDTEIRCRDVMQAHLYRALLQYARANDAFPPGNNDLRPLYGPNRTTSFHPFVCPGTENEVTTIDHLRDDTASTKGDGMSYFYQGGYSFWIEEGDDTRPLAWDQSPDNHRGRGVNIIFKDGHHEWQDEPPELQPSEQAAAH